MYRPTIEFPHYVRATYHLFFVDDETGLSVVPSLDYAKNDVNTDEMDDLIENKLLPALRKEFGENLRKMTGEEVQEYVETALQEKKFEELL